MVRQSLRVGIDGQAFASPAGGVRRYVSELCQAIRALDAGVELAVIGAPVSARLPAGLQALPEPASLPTNLGRHLTGLPVAVRRAGLDVFHAPAYTAPLWGTVPVVLTIHDVSYARQPAWYPYRRDPLRRAFYRLSARRARRIIAVSRFSRAEICAAYGIDPDVIHVIPSGVSAAFRPVPADVPRPPDQVLGGPYVFHVGDLHERRNLGVALRAVLALRQRHEQLRSLCLVLAGVDRGLGAAIDGEAERAGQADAVVRLGAVSEARLLTLYQHAAAFVYPSRYEGFGLPLLEAMACGRPVIASNAGALPEIVGSSGVLCDPDDETCFVDAMERVLLSRETAARMGTLARDRAALFTWERSAGQTVEVYRACLNPMSRSSS